MKKFTIIVIVNIIVSAALFLLLDWVNKNKGFCALGSNWNIINLLNIPPVDISEEDYSMPPENMQYLPVTKETYAKFCGEDRKNINTELPGRPIVFLGGSYTYGHGLELKETFPYIVSKLTNRKAYNSAACGDYLSVSIEKIKNSEEEQQKVKNAEYAVYLYMYDHINRYPWPDMVYPYLAELKPGCLEERLTASNQLLMDILPRLRLIPLYIEFPETKHASLYFKKILSAEIKELKTLMPDAEIIFIVFNQKIPAMGSSNPVKRVIKYEQNIIKSSLWKELQEEEGITVIHTKDVMGAPFDNKYILTADIAPFHPNALTWQEFAPKFAGLYIK